MREAEFREWLSDQGYSDSSIQSDIARMRRLEAAMPDFGLPDSNLDAAFQRDGMVGVVQALELAITQLPDVVPPLALVPRSINYKERLESALICARSYQALCNATNPATINAAELRKLKEHFGILHPDMSTFANCQSFNSTEGEYKRALVARAAEIIQDPESSDEATLGAALLDLVAGRTGLFSNLIDWRAMQIVDKSREARPGLVEAAAGKMVRNGAGPSEVIAFVETVWPELVVAGGNSKPYAESRMVPTMVAALVNPAEMLGIRSTPTNNAHKHLYDENAFGWNPLNREELDKVLAMARQIYAVMHDEWGWEPRDLWDVQGFIWETCQKKDAPTPADNDEDAIKEEKQTMDLSTNLILYGPPGTGKTYATAREAVALCDGDADYGDDGEGRAALMARYAELQQKGRIGFVTFHQNFSYEDFVEGLRPETDESNDGSQQSAGFSLKPHDGIFKQIAEKANTPPIGRPEQSLDITKIPIFKMSLGANYDPQAEFVYSESIDGDYALFGFKNVDWTPEEYSEKDAILAELQRRFPDEGITSSKGVVGSTDVFRNQLQIGDMLIVSMGISKFRAIGVVTGEYEYAPRPDGRYCHRRAVDWLWHDPEGHDVSEIYGTNFIMRTIYRLKDTELNRPAIAQLIARSDPDNIAVQPEPHVLIIDEINRANISKVFGELITLIEPDKRLGMTNALTVTLPYSKKTFGVPANLHIVGTMNTADRSIALLDTALRRRFTFREIAPDPGLLAEAAALTGLPLVQVLATINQRIEFLIDREHRIGHAFFMGCKTRAEVNAVMRDKVIPLLQEYFFEDWKQIWAVLGDGFIRQGKIPPPPGFADLEDRPTWLVRDDFGYDAYAKLIAGKAADQPQSDDGEADEGMDEEP